METLLVGLILAAAVLFLARRVRASVRAARTARDGCGSSSGSGSSGCGCAPAAGRVSGRWDELQ